MCFNIQTIPPPTAGTQKAVKWLQYLAISEVAVVLLKLIVTHDFGAFFELFLVFILYMSWAQLNACNCVIYVLYCLQQLLLTFIIFGTRVQNGLPFFGIKGDNQQPTLVVYFILFFYYIGACYVGFIAYKEFKILEYDQQSGLPQQDAQYIPQQNPPQQSNNNFFQPQYQQQQQQPQEQSSGFVAFQGRGVQLG